MIGGGLQIVFNVSSDTSNPNDSECNNANNPELNPAINLGLGKYLGVSLYPSTNQVSLNIGLGLALPISVSAQIDTVDHSDY